MLRASGILGDRLRWWTLAFVASAAGCTAVPIHEPGNSSDSGPTAAPDSAAIVSVVEAAYVELGHPQAVFLGANGGDNGAMMRAWSIIETDFPAVFRPMTERASGEPGAMIILGQFSGDDEDLVHVTAGLIHPAGDGRDCIAYAIGRAAEGWDIVEAVDASPNCPIITQDVETYDAGLARIQGQDCFGLWANLGTCGPWLFISESDGYGGTYSYYDPQTGLIVAVEQFTDVAESYVFPVVDCEPEISETIPCFRDSDQEP